MLDELPLAASTTLFLTSMSCPRARVVWIFQNIRQTTYGNYYCKGVRNDGFFRPCGLRALRYYIKRPCLYL